LALGLLAYIRIIMLICGAFAVGTRPSRSRIYDSCASGGVQKLLKIMCCIRWWRGNCCDEADAVRLMVLLRDCSVTFFFRGATHIPIICRAH